MTLSKHFFVFLMLNQGVMYDSLAITDPNMILSGGIFAFTAKNYELCCPVCIIDLLTLCSDCCLGDPGYEEYI